jgi:hypothetical protein
MSYNLHRQIFNIQFKFRFGFTRSGTNKFNTCKQCNKYYAELILVNYSERKRIQTKSIMYHMKMDGVYKTLKMMGRTETSYLGCWFITNYFILSLTFIHSNIYYQWQYYSYNFSIIYK